MTEPTNGGGGRADDSDDRPLFDPARERAIERERARQRQGQSNEREELESHWPESRRSDRESRRTTDAESDRTALGGADSSDSSGSGPGFASASDATRRGVGLTLLTGLLCALGYYGVLGVQASGVQAFGSVVPPPFYALTFSILFVFSLVPRAHRGLRALGWSIVFSVVFGALLAVGTEGAFYLADNPDVATAGYTGLTVLALAIVVASVAYWGVLSVAKTA